MVNARRDEQGVVSSLDGLSIAWTAEREIQRERERERKREKDIRNSREFLESDDHVMAVLCRSRDNASALTP